MAFFSCGCAALSAVRLRLTAGCQIYSLSAATPPLAAEMRPDSFQPRSGDLNLAGGFNPRKVEKARASRVATLDSTFELGIARRLPITIPALGARRRSRKREQVESVTGRRSLPAVQAAELRERGFPINMGGAQVIGR